MEEKLYYIHWKAIKTGKEGRGDTAYPKKQAELICDELNKHNKGWLEHWIVIADEKEVEE